MTVLAWTASILSIRDNPVPDGTKWLVVRFSYTNAGGSPDVALKSGSFDRTFKLFPANFTGPNAISDFIADQLAMLQALDATADSAQQQIGQTIIPGQGLLSTSTVVTNAQLRIALLRAGRYDAVNNAVIALGDHHEYYMAWNYAPWFKINSNFIVALANQLGLTKAQLQSSFSTASAIEV